MSDLISKEDIKELMRKYGFKAPDMTIHEFVEDCLPSTELKWKWIPVTEALPEMKEVVLITNKKGHVRCGQYQGTYDGKNYRWWWKHNTLEEVLAWMPLPEPWMGE